MKVTKIAEHILRLPRDRSLKSIIQTKKQVKVSIMMLHKNSNLIVPWLLKEKCLISKFLLAKLISLMIWKSGHRPDMKIGVLVGIKEVSWGNMSKRWRKNRRNLMLDPLKLVIIVVVWVDNNWQLKVNKRAVTSTQDQEQLLSALLCPQSTTVMEQEIILKKSPLQQMKNHVALW